MISTVFADISTTNKHSHQVSPVILSLCVSGTFCNLDCVSSVRNFPPTERELVMEYYDVYVYYGESDAQLALVLSVFSVIMGALAWLRKVASSFNKHPEIL